MDFIFLAVLGVFKKFSLKLSKIEFNGMSLFFLINLKNVQAFFEHLPNGISLKVLRPP